jgi:hypothetical protein
LAFTVVASALLIAFARGGGDAPLPEGFHWEGSRLDRDFAWAATAAERRAVVRLWRESNGVCHAELSIDGAPPQEIKLALVHGTQAGLDRTLLLTRAANDYSASCDEFALGPWHVTIAAPDQQWRIRSVARVLDKALPANAAIVIAAESHERE